MPATMSPIIVRSSTIVHDLPCIGDVVSASIKTEVFLFLAGKVTSGVQDIHSIDDSLVAVVIASPVVRESSALAVSTTTPPPSLVPTLGHVYMTPHLKKTL
eukprot:1493759-Ditylum_brightwellii.AAC.1